MIPENPYLVDSTLDRKLAQLVAAAPVPLPWSGAWQRLGEQSTPEERLAVYQAVRAAGSLPTAASFCLIAWHLGNVVLACPSEAMQRLRDELAALEECYVVEDGAAFPLGHCSEEFWEVDRCLARAEEVHYAATLAAFGEPEMAGLFRENRAAFDRLYNAGWEFFHGAWWPTHVEKVGEWQRSSPG
jgi:hypothetical protein